MFVNRFNEIWLDLTTDEQGDAEVRATLPYQFEPGRGPRSFVVHARHATRDRAAMATSVGRLACLDAGAPR
jgi:Cu-Zn family superoxide dismutase